MGNTNARRHGRYSAESREIRALGRLQLRTGKLLQAQLALINAHGDAHRVEVAEQQVSQCMQQLLEAALALDRVLGKGGDGEGRRRLVEGARRLAGSHDCDSPGGVTPFPPSQRIVRMKTLVPA